MAAIAIGSLTTEALAGIASPFDPRIQALRGHPGQIAVGAAFKRLLDDSPMRAISQASGKVQDPYSIRCQPQVLGACLDMIRNASVMLEIESNAASDNPLIFVETGEVISGGNFHAEPVAFAADMLAIAITEIGNLSERRCNLLLDPSFSGLPPMLTVDAGLHSGYMTAHISAAAMASEKQAAGDPGLYRHHPDCGQSGRSRVNGHARRPPSSEHDSYLARNPLYRGTVCGSRSRSARRRTIQRPPGTGDCQHSQKRTGNERRSAYRSGHGQRCRVDSQRRAGRGLPGAEDTVLSASPIACLVVEAMDNKNQIQTY
nr:hypothetical protein GCM10020185_87760 [Pseudomonas brassicacearum subsp. brassicacearum]